jgi:hypothetical protein
MALILTADRVQETTATTGTSTLNLAGAATQYQTFVSGIGTGNQCYYCILAGNGTDWEVGIGTVTSGSPATLSRTTILSSSNSGAAVSLTGTSTVFATFAATTANSVGGVRGSGNVVVGGNFANSITSGSNNGIFAGATNVISGSIAQDCVIIGGSQQTLSSTGSNNGMFVGNGNTISAGGGAAIIATTNGTISSTGNYNLIASGNSQVVGGSVATSAIIGGTNNTITSSGGVSSIVLAGAGNVITSTGSYCATVGGLQNTISSGSRNILIGGGQGTIAGGNAIIMLNGISCTASGSLSIVGGAYATDRGNFGAKVYGGGGNNAFSSAGHAQTETYVFTAKAISTTAVRLTADAAAAGAANIAALIAKSAATFSIVLTAIDATAGGSTVFTMGPGLIGMDSGGVSTTSMGTGNPIFVTGPTRGSIGTFSTLPTVTADTTNGGFNISVTPPAANVNTLYFTATVVMTLGAYF